jgi:hypothetical protein
MNPNSTSLTLRKLEYYQIYARGIYLFSKLNVFIVLVGNGAQNAERILIQTWVDFALFWP